MSNFSQMKILLIYPYFLNDRVYTIDDVRGVPLGVYYVAAVLKHGRYDVEILNWHNINTRPHQIRETFLGFPRGLPLHDTLQ